MQLVYKNTEKIKNKILLKYNYSIPNLMKRLQPLKFLALIFIISFASCSKDDMNKNGAYAGITVNLKSTASQYQKVFLEIEDVQVKLKADEHAPAAWLSLNAVNKGTHNVSDLTNDTELLLVNHFEIKPTYIHEIRLVLGDSNFMDLNGVLISLEVPENGNAMPSNLVKREFEGNHIYDIEIHIDVDESLSEHENTMMLHPKLYTEIHKF